MSVASLSVKDFVIDIPKVKREVKKKKQTKTQTPQTTLEVVLQNNTDFVLHRKTATTDKNFVFLISQNTFYIQDNKTKEVDNLDIQKIRVFFQPYPSNKFEELNQVQWWDGDIYNMTKIMAQIVANPTMQNMYKHGIYANIYRIDSWKEGFENNIKLFKYCYERCKESNVNKDNFDYILKLATEIEKRINFNNAKYFIDRFCESNIKMTLNDGYIGYGSSRRTCHDEFFEIINTYSLEFNRFIDYVSFDLYSQGISNFNFDILKTYSDYLRMQISLYGKIKEKYPKYLRTEHDIVALKVSIYERHKKDLLLLNVVKNYKHLEFKDDEYCIVIPETSMDIVDEGVRQSHCVASYVDKVVKNETLIVFMRRVKEPDVSLVTVEIDHNCIVQSAGFANRKITNEEVEFLKKWAKEKDLHYEI